MVTRSVMVYLVGMGMYGISPAEPTGRKRDPTTRLGWGAETELNGNGVLR